MKKISFSVRARSDLASVARESEAVWGEVQKQRYMLEFRERIERLGARPEIDRSLDPCGRTCDG